MLLKYWTLYFLKKERLSKTLKNPIFIALMEIIKTFFFLLYIKHLLVKLKYAQCPVLQSTDTYQNWNELVLCLTLKMSIYWKILLTHLYYKDSQRHRTCFCLTEHSDWCLLQKIILQLQKKNVLIICTVHSTSFKITAFTNCFFFITGLLSSLLLLQM